VLSTLFSEGARTNPLKTKKKSTKKNSAPSREFPEAKIWNATIPSAATPLAKSKNKFLGMACSLLRFQTKTFMVTFVPYAKDTQDGSLH
jgi:hypothetical protein